MSSDTLTRLHLSSLAALRLLHLSPLCCQPPLDHRSDQRDAPEAAQHLICILRKTLIRGAKKHFPREEDGTAGTNVADGESKHGGGKKRAAVSHISSRSKDCCQTNMARWFVLFYVFSQWLEFWKVLPVCPGQSCSTTGSILINKMPSGVSVI